MMELGSSPDSDIADLSEVDLEQPHSVNSSSTKESNSNPDSLESGPKPEPQTKKTEPESIKSVSENSKSEPQTKKSKSGSQIPVQGTKNPEPESILTAIPDVESSLFASSGAKIILPSERKRHAMVFWISGLLFFTAILGIINGLDYINGDSGLINHRRFINMDAETAPAGSAVLLGTVLFEDGSPAPEVVIQVTVEREDGTIIEKSNTTDDNGNFRIADLDPGVHVLLMANGSRGTAQLVQHLVLLSPPPKMAMEPLGFTTLTLTFPSDETFSEESEDGYFLNYVPYEAVNEMQLYDSSAAGIYVMVGVGFTGIALIGMAATVLGFRENSRVMLRMGAALIFFSQGPYASACCLGLVAFLLTFALPKVHSE